MKKAGHSQESIAELSGRSRSTISREIRRNTGLKGYRPAQAQRFSANRRQEAHKRCKLSETVCEWLTTLIKQELSPAQVLDYLARHKKLSLQHETLYRFIYADKAAGGQLYQHLPIVSKPCRKRYGRYERRGKLPNRLSIEQRPKVVERRQHIGDWEDDTVIGKGRQSALLTLVERKTLVYSDSPINR